MGNFTSSSINTMDNNKDNNIEKTDWFKKLKKWEIKIQEKNAKINKDTNNSPLYLKQLNKWADNIKIENFQVNNECNNAPDDVIKLKNENDKLRDLSNKFEDIHF